MNGKHSDDSFISVYSAKRVGDLSKMPFFNTENRRHYPWVYNFSRGMPWVEKGFDEWKKGNV